MVEEKFNIKDVDMTSQLLKAKEAGAECMLTYGIGPELAQIANGMEKLGWKVPMIGSWTLSMANFIDNAGKNGDGARMPQTFIQDADTPKRKAFIAAYQKTSTEDRAHPLAGVGGPGLRLGLSAGRRDHARPAAPTAPKIRAALENLKDAGRWRGQDLRQAVHARRPRSHQARRCR